MASAPKKRDFFNGSQRLNLTETQEESMVPEQNVTSGGRNGFSSSQDFLGHSSGDCPFPSFSNRQSSPVYNCQDSCPSLSSRYSIRTKRDEYENSKGTSYESNSVPEYLSSAGSAEVASLAKHDGNYERKKKVEKRKQRCRLCANHGKYEEIKGHKWYCEYRKPQHKCSLCEITHKKRLFLPKNEIRRKQHDQEQQLQQQLNVQNRSTDEPWLDGYGRVGLPPSPTTEHIDFPRLQELVEETASILDDEDLFRQINERIPLNVLQH
ncbi:uncharacterized protein LOC123504522 isoform X2 [Portunus trituberculatus]|nr:uncharacterized protein LOC123504522 isoform X2 [Portunus trituberculatus]XP_045111043.1 uncharacterized protein LOC123504522 isoform X2 [Portunus trituberculatus]